MHGDLAPHSTRAVKAINSPVNSIEAFIAFRIRTLTGPGHHWPAAKVAVALGLDPNEVREVVLKQTRSRTQPDA
jgi:hypothetical protein